MQRPEGSHFDGGCRGHQRRSPEDVVRRAAQSRRRRPRDQLPRPPRPPAASSAASSASGRRPRRLQALRERSGASGYDREVAPGARSTSGSGRKHRQGKRRTTRDNQLGMMMMTITSSISVGRDNHEYRDDDKVLERDRARSLRLALHQSKLMAACKKTIKSKRGRHQQHTHDNHLKTHQWRS